MSDTKIDIELDPAKVGKAMDDMSEWTKALSKDIEDHLGVKAVQAMEDMVNASEKGSNKIAGFFKNLGQRVKEDLKTAFDVGAVMQGLKFANELSAGVKQVFEMERAFDRLNTRLSLTNTQMNDFKKNVGRAVAGTGQKLEDVLPGVETAAAKGKIKSPQQLTAIAESLGQAKAITGEDTSKLSDTIVEILKSQGQKVTSESFKKTMDTLSGTRTAGAFHTAGEAGAAVAQLSPYGQKLGLNTRDMGGLAAMASRSGDGGQDILRQMMEKGSTIGGGEQINAALGAQVFKNGKMNAKALGGVNTERFGQYSQQVMEHATGITGANGADLKRFIESFKAGSEDLEKVTNGANETSAQFEVATDNLVSKLDMFREKTKEAAREVAGDISKAANDLMKGNFKGASKNLGEAAKSLWENKGTVASAVGITAAVGLMAGGGARRLLSKVGGGAIGGMIGGEAAKAAGVTPVYVVNASDIGGGGMGGAAGAGMGLMGKAGMVGAAGLAGYGVGSLINQATGNNGQMGEWLYNKMHPDEMQADGGAAGDPAAMKKAIVEGVVEGHIKAKAGQKVQFTNPSNMSGGRGGGR